MNANKYNYQPLYDIFEKYGDWENRIICSIPIILYVCEKIPIIKTYTYECSKCASKFVFPHPTMKGGTGIHQRILQLGIDGKSFLPIAQGVKERVLPTIAYRKWEGGKKWFISYNCLDEIVGTDIEPHKNITMCARCIYKECVERIEKKEFNVDVRALFDCIDMGSPKQTLMESVSVFDTIDNVRIYISKKRADFCGCEWIEEYNEDEDEDDSYYCGRCKTEEGETDYEGSGVCKKCYIQRNG